MKHSSVALVEDNFDSAEMLLLMLEASGIQDVHWFSCGKDFLDAEASSFDVVLLDISLPDMDGYGVLRQLRETNTTLPVIAVTANASGHDVEKGRLAGFTDYVTKPILDVDGFCALVKSYITEHLAA